MKVAEIASKSLIEQFFVGSGDLRVTDPCYDLTAWCSGQLRNVKNGTWNAQVGYYKDPEEFASSMSPSTYAGRVAYLHIYHDSVEPQEVGDMNNGVWRLAEHFEVGVDSGQAGFFDLDFYKEQKEDESRDRVFYDEVCRLTCHMDKTGVDRSFGVVERGAVSSSGYGDGSYDCYFRHDEDMQVVEAIIAFIQEDDPEED